MPLTLIADQHTQSLLLSLGIDNDNVNSRSDESSLYTAGQLAPFTHSAAMQTSRSIHHIIDYNNAAITASSTSGSLNTLQDLAQQVEFSYFKADFMKGNAYRFSKLGGFEVSTDEVTLMSRADVEQRILDFKKEGNFKIQQIEYSVSQSNDDLPHDWIPGFWSI